MKLIIAGGGWAGCAAANIAARNGIDTTILERTDMLLGTGLVGGIMRNNGRYTATEEMIAAGGGQLFELIDANLRHKNISFPGHEHACLYDIAVIPDVIREYLISLGVHIHLNHRVINLTKTQDQIVSVTCSDNKEYHGDVFIDATGTSGPMRNCREYGNGCSMCIMRCPSFGSRLSLTSLAGLPEISGYRKNGKPGSFSGSCKLFKESLSPDLVERLNRDGVVIVPIPVELRENHLDEKSCQQYAAAPYSDNLILLDTGHAKLMTPYYPLDKLKQIPGFSHARYEDPYAAGIGNSIRFTSCCHRDNALKVDNINNLWCAGEKAGLMVGHTEAIVTGSLAGLNASRYACGKDPVILPRSLCIGELIAYTKEQMETTSGLFKKYSFSGSVFFEHMKALDLYTIDIPVVQKRIQNSGMENIFSFA